MLFPVENIIRESLGAVKQRAFGCERCALSQTRTNVVFGEGSPEAKICFIGEGPGATEDQEGRPFVGRAGKLLDQMIGAMGLKREEVYITNTVLCRPPENRRPSKGETQSCREHWETQIKIVNPKVIIALGKTAANVVLKTKKDKELAELRGKWGNWNKIPVMVTYHPAFLLRPNGAAHKKQAWQDLQLAMIKLRSP